MVLKFHISKKSQISLEFIIFLGLASFIGIIFTLMSISEARNIGITKEAVLIKEVAHKIKSEVNLASVSLDGYVRSFTLPEKINNKLYNAEIKNNTLTVSTEGSAYHLKILNATGNIKIGKNYIKRTNGLVQIN